MGKAAPPPLGRAKAVALISKLPHSFDIKIIKGGAVMPRNKERTLDAYIGAKVRMRRLMLNMSQETLSGKLGVTFQQVQKYEKGLNRISASRLNRRNF